MLLIRRLPSLLYHHRHKAIGLFLTVFVFATLFYLLVNWGVVCTNTQATRHISKVCEMHAKGEVVGSLCPALCIEKSIHSPACQTFHAGKEAVFSMERKDGTRFVFKMSSHRTRGLIEEDSIFPADSMGNRNFPTEAEFRYMVQEVMSAKLNISISEEQINRLIRLTVSHEPSHPSHAAELLALWRLAHDHEFTCSAMFGDKGVFPRLLGTCGPLYAVEYLDPMPRDASWIERVRLALLTMDLLQQLEEDLPEPFHLCDVKVDSQPLGKRLCEITSDQGSSLEPAWDISPRDLSKLVQPFVLNVCHFGIASGGDRVKFLDLDSVLPRRFAGHITGDGRRCERHVDCDYFDCRSQCSDSTGTCDSSVSNNNLQIVCEKLFLGWTLSGAVLVPGLLMSADTPEPLAGLLRICSNPEPQGSDVGRFAATELIRTRLYNMLSDMYNKLNTNN